MNSIDYARVFSPLLNWVTLFEKAGAVVKIGSSLKPYHHKQVKLVQNSEMLYINLERNVLSSRDTFNGFTRLSLLLDNKTLN